MNTRFESQILSDEVSMPLESQTYTKVSLNIRKGAEDLIVEKNLPFSETDSQNLQVAWKHLESDAVMEEMGTGSGAVRNLMVFKFIPLIDFPEDKANALALVDEISHALKDILVMPNNLPEIVRQNLGDANDVLEKILNPEK